MMAEDTSGDVENPARPTRSGRGDDDDDRARRFRFEPKSVGNALSIQAYLRDEAIDRDAQSFQGNDFQPAASYGGGGGQQQSGNNTSANYRHANSHGMLVDTDVLRGVIASFLVEKLELAESLDRTGAGQELASLDAALANQWSLVEVMDRAAASSEEGGASARGRSRQRIHRTGARAGNLRGRRLSIDVEIQTGEEIEIEERPAGEMIDTGNAPKGMACWNPAFDVTPAKYITGIITEKGVLKRGEDGTLDVIGFVKRHS